MNFIRKVFLYFKSILNKKEEVKKIDAPKDTGNEKEKFIENLKVTTTYRSYNYINIFQFLPP